MSLNKTLDLAAHQEVLIITGSRRIVAWFLIVFIFLGTTLTLYFLVSLGCRRQKPFTNNMWYLLAIQASTGYMVIFVCFKELFGKSLCTIQNILSRLGTVLHIGPILVIAVWSWFKITAEGQKEAVSMGDPVITRKFLKKKKLISGWAIGTQLLLLCLPPFFGIIYDASANDGGGLCNDDLMKVSSRIASPFYSVCSLFPIVIMTWTWCKFRLGRAILKHIIQNVTLVIVLLVLKLKFPETPNWNPAYFMLLLQFPLWDMWFIWYPVWKNRRNSLKWYNSGAQRSSYETTQTNNASTYSTAKLENKAQQNPSHIGKRMFMRLVLSTTGGKEFKAHMEEMFCAEIYLFYMAVEKFKRKPSVKAMIRINSTYIGQDAPLEVNLPAQVVDAIIAEADRKKPGRDMYNEAQLCIAKLMKTNLANKFRFSAVAWNEALLMRRHERNEGSQIQSPKMTPIIRTGNLRMTGTASLFGDENISDSSSEEAPNQEKGQEIEMTGHTG